MVPSRRTNEIPRRSRAPPKANQASSPEFSGRRHGRAVVPSRVIHDPEASRAVPEARGRQGATPAPRDHIRHSNAKAKASRRVSVAPRLLLVTVREKHSTTEPFQPERLKGNRALHPSPPAYRRSPQAFSGDGRRPDITPHRVHHMCVSTTYFPPTCPAIHKPP